VLYNKERIKNYKSVVTPPYDLITPEDQNRFYKKHKNNIIRLELGKQFSEDNQSNNCYTRAAKFFEEWLDKGILLKEDVPSIYLYELGYIVNGEKRTLSGFICLVSLDEGLMPHESTYSKPKADRLNLLQSCGASFSQIFGLYPDTKNNVISKLASYVKGTEPRISFISETGIQNKLWQIKDTGIINHVKELMDNKPLFIADGHHRYETALNYRKAMLAKTGMTSGKESFNYVMVFLANIENPGLMILPTHRLIRYKDSIDFSAIEKRFKIEEFRIDNNEMALRKRLLSDMKRGGGREHVFGMLYPKNRAFCLLALKDEKILNDIIDKDHSPAWRQLDVTILHKLIIEDVLNIKNNNEGHIAYEQDDNVVAEKVLSGEYEIGLFLNPTKITEVVEIAKAKDRMPQKSTYFFPKPLTGLVINKITDEMIENL
jgi:uncharacterized protein (DUF1015 family)